LCCTRRRFYKGGWDWGEEYLWKVLQGSILDNNITRMKISNINIIKEECYQWQIVAKTQMDPNFLLHIQQCQY
jgi:hypothetical protein